MKSCKLIKAGHAYSGKQGLDYFAGISAESAGSERLCLHIVTIPPGASARPHYHAAHDSAVFVLEGYSEMRHGHHLEEVMAVRAGDFVYIPAGVPHQPYNPTDRPVRAVIARTDPNEQESVVLLGETP
jgi:uncharacterized RmlC-like cupin family protein